MRNIELKKWLNDHTSKSDVKNNLYNIRLLQSFLKTQLHSDINRFTYGNSFDRFVHTLISSRVFREADRRVGHKYTKALVLYTKFLKYSVISQNEITVSPVIPVYEDNLSASASENIAENEPTALNSKL